MDDDANGDIEAAEDESFIVDAVAASDGFAKVDAGAVKEDAANVDGDACGTRDLVVKSLPGTSCSSPSRLRLAKRDMFVRFISYLAGESGSRNEEEQGVRGKS